MSSVAPSQDTAPACHVHKFGGSSLADAAHMRALAPLIDDGAGMRLVVVSAMQGTTNALIALATAASERQDWIPAWSALRQRHLDAADALASAGDRTLRDALDADFAGLHDDFAALAAGAPESEQIAARVHGIGEICSSRLVHAALGGEAGGWQRLDARDVLVVHPGQMGVGVDWDASRQRYSQWRAHARGRDTVVTGSPHAMGTAVRSPWAATAATTRRRSSPTSPMPTR